jgi:hypothetical protein
MTVRRTKIAILLVIVFLLALLAPVQAGWACPDGTPCVADRDHGFACASDQCRSHASCCEVEKPQLCRHGTLPEVSDPVSTRPAIQGPDHCRFSVTAKPDLKAAAEQTGKLISFSVDLLPTPAAVELTVPAASPIWQSEYTLGYRPPPSLSTGPSRAPPVA